MKEAFCPYCKKIIIEDWDKFLRESKEKQIQCPYCKGFMDNPKFKLKKQKNEN